MDANLPFEVTDVFWMTVKVWDEYDVIVHQGGTSSSKTYSILQWLVLKAVEKRRVITVIGQDIPNLKAGAMRDLETIVAESEVVQGWITRVHRSEFRWEFFNGSIIEFKSYKDGQDAKSGKRDISFFNEANGILHEVYEEIAVRTKEKVLLDFNANAAFWVHKKLLGEPGVIRLITNYRHNQKIPPKTLKKILRYRLTNEHRWRVYGLGLTGQVEGIIFPNVEWIKETEFPSIDKLQKFGYGLDYGYANDPLALVRAGMFNGNVYAQGMLYGTGIRLEEIVQALETWQVSIYDEIAMDSTQAAEQAELLAEEHRYNIVTANRRGGSINSGIGLLLEQPLMIVHDEDWIAEQENYKWVTKRGETLPRPVDKYNHYWDALRYWALEKLGEPELSDYKPSAHAV